MTRIADDADGAPRAVGSQGDGRGLGGGDHGSSDQPPKPLLRRMRWPFPWIWMVPVLALVGAGFYFRKAVTDRGPTITLHLADGSGLKPGDTTVSHLGVKLGQVEKIELAPDQSQALVQVRLSKAGESYAKQGARFWVVRPEFSAGGISGLSTITSGPYIEALPGYGPQITDFVALPRAPQDQAAGMTLVMHAPRLEHVQPGSALTYRGIQVGAVQSINLSQDSTGIDVHVFVRERYAILVHKNSKFWITPGVDLKGGIFSGLQFKLESLRTLISGGITFATPEEKAGPMARDGENFPLYTDAKKEWPEWSPRIDLPPVDSDADDSSGGGSTGMPGPNDAARAATK